MKKAKRINLTTGLLAMRSELKILTLAVAAAIISSVISAAPESDYPTAKSADSAVEKAGAAQAIVGICPHPIFAGPKFFTGQGGGSVAIGDLDGDGILDLAVGNTKSEDCSVLRGHGDGTFAPQEVYQLFDDTRTMVIEDLNGDGYPDLVGAHNGGFVISVLMNNGDGTFEAEVTYDVGFSPISVDTGDLNGDGHADIVTANASSDDISVLMNAGDGTFPSDKRYLVGESPYSIVVGDLDGNQGLDLAVANKAPMYQSY